MRGSTKILIVEDEPETLRLSIIMVQTAFPHATVHAASNREEGVLLFKQYRHDIVVSDYRMPNKGDGVILADELCRDKPDVIFFFVTADDLKDELERHPNLCVAGVVPKPLDFSVLIRAITEAIATMTIARGA